MVDISVIIVNWNTKGLLRQCLSSLFHHTPVPPEFSWDVWVVDNASSDGSPEMGEQEFPSVHLLRNQQNLGFSIANNRALRQASGRYLLLLNSDTELVSDVLRPLVRFMDSHPSAGIAGTKLLNSDGSRQYSSDQFPRAPLTMLKEKIFRTDRTTERDVDSNVRVDYVIGAVLAIRRETLEQIGLLDETFFMYAEDIDWCYRAALAGWQTYYLGTLSVYHHNRGSSETTPELSQKLHNLRTKSLLKFYRKHYGVWSAWSLRVLIFTKRIIRRT